ncbi:MAG TPA: SMI1/KNR4 family protein [Verrucomicrobiae bacterium]|jgi:hypothetical protein|nr:SMI1/KNR4 family protein [Verrucomicrobiae bacterium]
MIIVESICDQRPTDQEIVALESCINGRLPNDYKDFLKQDNGGRPKPNKFEFATRSGKTEESTVHYFFALWDQRVGNLKKNFERYRRRLPSGFLPIGLDPFGNVIAIHIFGEKSGKIYFWDHEKESDLPSLNNMFLIANSFDEFVQHLK